jgi:hypothetical protein
MKIFLTALVSILVQFGLAILAWRIQYAWLLLMCFSAYTDRRDM